MILVIVLSILALLVAALCWSLRGLDAERERQRIAKEYGISDDVE